MTVTTRHPESKHGYPVILDEEGRVLDPAIALRFFRRYHGLGALEFARMCDVSTGRLAAWERGRTKIPLNVYNVMRDWLEDERARVLRGELRVCEIYPD